MGDARVCGSAGREVKGTLAEEAAGAEETGLPEKTPVGGGLIWRYQLL